MSKLRALMLLGLCFAAPVKAGLFSDDEARNSIQQVEVRVLKLEEQGKQQIQSVLDQQGQIEVLNGQLRNLRGQNEETAHGLQDAEKREKDFYVDLDTRLRHLEATEAAAAPKPADVSAAAADPEDPVVQNRAIEAAYAQVKAENYADAVKSLQDFLQKYPASVHVPNAAFWLGSAQFALKDYKASLLTYRALLKFQPDTARAPDVYFNIAGCQQALKAVAQATATLKQLIAKYPDSTAAAKAKKLLSASK
ncbi:MAG: tol-pal system protein YbgF [Proteobacteria bacterium]|nr:tol-pal system protein YbgF [Pseudomonadota bacterium]